MDVKLREFTPSDYLIFGGASSFHSEWSLGLSFGDASTTTVMTKEEDPLIGEITVRGEKMLVVVDITGVQVYRADADGSITARYCEWTSPDDIPSQHVARMIVAALPAPAVQGPWA